MSYRASRGDGRLSQADIARFISLADELTPPSFAAFLAVAGYEGMRPELDALDWNRIDFQAGTSWSTTSGARRSPPSRCPSGGSHYRPSSRSYPWNRVRCAAGLGNVDLSTATRHYFGWYAFNVLGLPDHVIALQFGHRDGGKLCVHDLRAPRRGNRRRRCP